MPHPPKVIDKYAVQTPEPDGFLHFGFFYFGLLDVVAQVSAHKNKYLQSLILVMIVIYTMKIKKIFYSVNVGLLFFIMGFPVFRK